MAATLPGGRDVCTHLHRLVDLPRDRTRAAGCRLQTDTGDIDGTRAFDGTLFIPARGDLFAAAVDSRSVGGTSRAGPGRGDRAAADRRAMAPRVRAGGALRRDVRRDP